jgi:quercetin dioxygenase-like cupin family protein
MAKLIESPTQVAAVGSPPKTIMEYVGRANTGSEHLSIARMTSPAGWSEPGQRPEFAEVTLVLSGAVHVETESGTHRVGPSQAIMTEPGEWVRYSTPEAEGAEYLAVCLPAFSPDTVHRDA